MEQPDGYKLLLTYDVKPETMQGYYHFMLGRYVPLLAELGLEMSDAWHTAYGQQPDRLVGFIARDEATLHAALETDIWDSLMQELNRYVTNFSYKVVPYRHGFQF
jgi:hypothetical protein